jgi:peptidoglycan hydrolase FlgJ
MEAVSSIPLPIVPDAKARAAAQTFEAEFLGQMTRLMMESVEQDGAFSGGHGEEMFRGILAETMGREMARTTGAGLADQVMHEILRLQAAGQREQDRESGHER